MFHILGLPRTRTAWLANFMTDQGLFCFHEGINGCRSIAEYRKKIGDNGDSGTGLMLFDMNSLFPDSPKVIIESDGQRAIDFVAQAYGVYNPDKIYYFMELLDKVDGLRIKFEEIDERLEEIWSHLTDKPFNKERAEMLKKLNIQVKNPYDVDFAAMKELFDVAI